jgi:branched-subunit amino acid transport protein
VSLGLILLLAALTYGSRVLALAVLPAPPPAVERVLNRVPAPLFAGLAMLSIVGPEGEVAPGPVILASIGALCAAPFRSLLAVLAAGLVGYALGVALLG